MFYEKIIQLLNNIVNKTKFEYLEIKLIFKKWI